MQNRNYVFFAAVTAVAVLFLGASRINAAPQYSATQASPTNRVIRVSGTAVVYGKPDYASVEFGVVKTSPKLSTAKASCDQTMKGVQDALRKAGIAADDIQTTSYDIFPFQPNNKPGTERQWKVAHEVTVRIRKVPSVASVLDAAAMNGVTSISRVQYGIEKVLELRSKARAEAVRVAREKAMELARLNGVEIGAPISISDNSYEGYAAQSMANVSSDYPGMFSRGEGVLRGGQIAINARTDVEFGIR